MAFDLLGDNGLRTAKELAAERPHGDRLKYMSGCRCVPCRAANSRYETERSAARRRGEWNGFIDASEASRHLQRLSDKGIGRDTVNDLTGIAVSTIDKVRTGKQAHIRAMNAKAILSISPDLVITDAQLVSAKPAWTMIKWMLREGFSKAEISRRLGNKTGALQLNKHLITARNAAKIQKLYNTLRAGDDDFEEASE